MMTPYRDVGCTRLIPFKSAMRTLQPLNEEQEKSVTMKFHVTAPLGAINAQDIFEGEIADIGSETRPG